MSRFKTAKKLDAIDVRINALETERRTLEERTLGDAITEEDTRRKRYFSITDQDTRRRLISLDRDLHEKRTEQDTATLAYWGSVIRETRGKLTDLQEASLHSAWQRGVWYDIFTILWILVGGGYLLFLWLGSSGWLGALGGAAFTAVWTPVLRRGREKTRLKAIRNGEDILHSAENELRLATHQAGLRNKQPLFSTSEAASGVPDPSPDGTID